MGVIFTIFNIKLKIIIPVRSRSTIIRVIYEEKRETLNVSRAVFLCCGGKVRHKLREKRKTFKLIKIQ